MFFDSEENVGEVGYGGFVILVMLQFVDQLYLVCGFGVGLCQVFEVGVVGFE